MLIHLRQPLVLGHMMPQDSKAMMELAKVVTIMKRACSLCKS